MRPPHAIALAVCLALIGCASDRQRLHQALLSADHPAVARELPAQYAIRCPDVLAVRAANRPDLEGQYPVGPDGTIRLLSGSSLFVSGLTAPQVSARLAREAGLVEANVVVSVHEHKSQSLYLVGEVEAEHRVIGYHGPETVIDLLRRIDVGKRADIAEVRVVRGHVADGKPPEVFSVDVSAILMRRDYETNVLLEPSDHIHIAPRRPSRISCFLPPWYRPLYEAWFGIN